MSKVYDEDGVELHHGDCLAVLRSMPDAFVQTCVTSPPYFGLRDYNVDGQIGLETTADAYVAKLVDVFREVRRALRDDGTLWLNLGDSYNAYNGNRGPAAGANKNHHNIMPDLPPGNGLTVKGLKPKDLIGIPWMVAFALRADGWYLRSEIIWHKPNPMPESVTDRPTKAHEQIFLLSKSERYFYDAEAIAEEATGCSGGAAFGKVNLEGPGSRRISAGDNARIRGRANGKWSAEDPQSSGRRITDRVAEARANGADHDSPFGPTRNRRSVWTITTKPFAGAHFATFPPDLIEPCVKAGSRPGDVVLDPFNGSGTTGAVAQKWGRRYVGIELNAEYLELTKGRFMQRVLFGAAS